MMEAVMISFSFAVLYRDAGSRGYVDEVDPE